MVPDAVRLRLHQELQRDHSNRETMQGRSNDLMRDVLLSLERAAGALNAFGPESDVFDIEMKGVAELVTELQAIGRANAPYCVDESQTEYLLLTALHSARPSVVSSAVEALKGAPIREDRLPEHVFFAIFERLSELLEDRKTYSYATLQQAASVVPRFFSVERLQPTTIQVACSNGLATSLFGLLAITSRTTLYGGEEELLQGLQQKAAYCLWFLFANAHMAGEQQNALTEALFKGMTVGNALRRLVALCTSEYDSGRVQRMALKALHSFIKLDVHCAEATINAGGLAACTHVVGTIGPAAPPTPKMPAAVRHDNFRQATLLCADLVLAQDMLDQGQRSASRRPGRQLSVLDVPRFDDAPSKPVTDSEFVNTSGSRMATYTQPTTPVTPVTPVTPGTPATPVSPSSACSDVPAVMYDYPEFRKWPSRKLKEYIQGGGIDMTGCSEKAELIALCKLRFRRENNGIPAGDSPQESAGSTAALTAAETAAAGDRSPSGHALSDFGSAHTSPRLVTAASEGPPLRMTRDISFDSPTGICIRSTPGHDSSDEPQLAPLSATLDDGDSPPATPRSIRAFPFEVPPAFSASTTPRAVGAGAAAPTSAGSGNSSGAHISFSPFMAGRPLNVFPAEGGATSPSQAMHGTSGHPSPRSSVTHSPRGGSTPAYPQMPTSPAAAAPAHVGLPDVTKMGVGELKRLLAKAKANYQHCVEKQELVALAQGLPDHVLLFATQEGGSGGSMASSGGRSTPTNGGAIPMPRTECPEFRQDPLKEEAWAVMADTLVDVLAGQARYNKNKAIALSAICGVPPSALNNPSAKGMALIKSSLHTRIGLQRILTSNFLTDVLSDATDKERVTLANSGLLMATAQQLMSPNIDLIAPSMTALAHFAETPSVAASMWPLGLMHPILNVLLSIPPTQAMMQPSSRHHLALVACLRLLSNIMMPGNLSRSSAEPGADVEAHIAAGKDHNARRVTEWFCTTGGVIRVHDVLRSTLQQPQHMEGINQQFKYLSEKQKVLKYPAYQCLRVMRHMLVAAPYTAPNTLLGLPGMTDTIIQLLDAKRQPIEVARSAGLLTSSLCRHAKLDSSQKAHAQTLSQLVHVGRMLGLDVE